MSENKYEKGTAGQSGTHAKTTVNILVLSGASVANFSLTEKLHKRTRNVVIAVEYNCIFQELISSCKRWSDGEIVTE